MKKLLPIAVFLLAFCLASCNKPAENPPEVTTAASTSDPAVTTTFATVATLDEWITLPTTAVPETEITTTKAPETVPAPPVTTKAAVTEYTGSTETESALPTAITSPDPDYKKVEYSTDKATYTLDDEVVLTLRNSSEKELFRYNAPFLMTFVDGEWVHLKLKQTDIEFLPPRPESDPDLVNSDFPYVYSCSLRSEYGELPAGKYRFGCVVCLGAGKDTRTITTAEFEIVE